MFACLWCGDEVKPPPGYVTGTGGMDAHLHPFPCSTQWQQADPLGWSKIPSWLFTNCPPVFPWGQGSGFYPACAKHGYVPAWVPPPATPSGVPQGFFPPGTLVLRDVPEVMTLEPGKLYAGCWKCGVQLCEALDQYLGSDPRGRNCCINCQRKLGVYA